MKITKRFVLTFATLICCSAAIFAQSAKREIVEIDAYAKTVDAQTKRGSISKRVLADVADYDQNKSEWRQFASEKALEKHRESAETYSIAYVWLTNKNVIASNFTLFSPSGDWTKYIFSYYRPDGTLAKVSIDYRTFYGDLMILQKLYFDRAGRLIKKTSEVRDLATHKLKKHPNKDEVAGNGELLNRVDYFKTTSKLPFRRLLTQR